MNLFYDERDDKLHEARGSQILYWLDDIGAKPLSEARPEDEGFLFAGARSIADYRQLVGRVPLLCDRPDARQPLLMLDSVLDSLSATAVQVPTPITWYLNVDDPVPEDITYPLFVRTALSSLKIGGKIHRVNSAAELESEARELRRVFGWNALVVARVWHDFAKAGQSIYGPIPQEVRVWIIDQIPFTWSFHHLNVVSKPNGFPPTEDELLTLKRMATEVGRAFQSRLVVADFAREIKGEWMFIEAGPGSCAGTAHEGVFKAVASRLLGQDYPCQSDDVGGLFTE